MWPFPFQTEMLGLTLISTFINSGKILKLRWLGNPIKYLACFLFFVIVNKDEKVEDLLWVTGSEGCNSKYHT